jgi:hypothetical protein
MISRDLCVVVWCQDEGVKFVELLNEGRDGRLVFRGYLPE